MDNIPNSRPAGKYAEKVLSNFDINRFDGIEIGGFRIVRGEWGDIGDTMIVEFDDSDPEGYAVFLHQLEELKDYSIPVSYTHLRAHET